MWTGKINKALEALIVLIHNDWNYWSKSLKDAIDTGGTLSPIRAQVIGLLNDMRGWRRNDAQREMNEFIRTIRLMKGFRHDDLASLITSAYKNRDTLQACFNKGTFFAYSEVNKKAIEVNAKFLIDATNVYRNNIMDVESRITDADSRLRASENEFSGWMATWQKSIEDISERHAAKLHECEYAGQNEFLVLQKQKEGRLWKGIILGWICLGAVQGGISYFVLIIRDSTLNSMYDTMIAACIDILITSFIAIWFPKWLLDRWIERSNARKTDLYLRKVAQNEAIHIGEQLATTQEEFNNQLADYENRLEIFRMAIAEEKEQWNCIIATLQERIAQISRIKAVTNEGKDSSLRLT
jgi:hypothetical protein